MRLSPPRAAVAALLLAAACAPVPGGPGVSGGAATVTVGGEELTVRPPDGLCVTPEGVAYRNGSAFVLVEDCALAAGPEAEGPRTLGGIVTISLSKDPLFRNGADRGGLAGLAEFLASDEGRGSAGMGGGAADVSIRDSRIAGDTLYLLIEDRGGEVLPMLGPTFWRAFTQVRGRAAIASIGVFDGEELGEPAMLRHLARVVAALKSGNGAAVAAEEAALFGGTAVAAVAEAAPAAPSEGKPPAAASAATEEEAEETPPAAAAPAEAAEEAEAPAAPEEGASGAPGAAPAPPAHPRRG